MAALNSRFEQWTTLVPLQTDNKLSHKSLKTHKLFHPAISVKSEINDTLHTMKALIEQHSTAGIRTGAGSHTWWDCGMISGICFSSLANFLQSKVIFQAMYCDNRSDMSPRLPLSKLITWRWITHRRPEMHVRGTVGFFQGSMMQCTGKPEAACGRAANRGPYKSRNYTELWGKVATSPSGFFYIKTKPSPLSWLASQWDFGS